jgi:hypothetical protein
MAQLSVRRTQLPLPCAQLSVIHTWLPHPCPTVLSDTFTISMSVSAWSFKHGCHFHEHVKHSVTVSDRGALMRVATTCTRVWLMDTYEMEPMRVRQRDTHEVATMRQCLTYRTHQLSCLTHLPFPWVFPPGLSNMVATSTSMSNTV